MRGRREPQVSMLAFIDLETRVPAGHPLRTIKGLGRPGLGPAFARVRPNVRSDRAAFHSSRTTAEGFITDFPVLGAQ